MVRFIRGFHENFAKLLKMLTEEQLKLRNEIDSIGDLLSTKNIISRFDELSLGHYLVFKEECGRVESLFLYSYDLIVNLMFAVNYAKKDVWTKRRWHQYLLLHSNMKTIRSSFERAIKGFYMDSVILIRPVYESVILSIFMTCYPECVDYICFDDDYIKQNYRGSRMFNLTSFLKKDLGLDWATYKILSKSSHINRFEMMSEYKKFFVDEDSKSKPINLAINFDKDLLSFGVNYINHILYAYLQMITKFFLIEANQGVSQEKLDQATYFLNLLKKMLLGHEGNFWARVTNDIDDIFEMMLHVENYRCDWQAKWYEIRFLRWFQSCVVF